MLTCSPMSDQAGLLAWRTAPQAALDSVSPLSGSPGGAQVQDNQSVVDLQKATAVKQNMQAGSTKFPLQSLTTALEFGQTKAHLWTGTLDVTLASAETFLCCLD